MSDFIDFLRKNKDISLLVLLILISVISLELNTEMRTFQPARIGFSIVSVFQRGAAGIGSFFADTVNSINELSDLKDQYEQLQTKLVEYEEIERNIEELKSENKYLRDQLGFSKTSPYQNIPAEVIGKDPGNTFHSIIINKGRVDGIRRDMPVIGLQDGYHGLVGEIAQVGEFTSIIIPIYDETAYVSARLQESRYEGLINGSGYSDSILKMNYVTKMARENVKYGDFVITSGMKSIFPKGIYIGRVTAIEGKDWDTSLQLEIEPIVDFTKLEYVFVLTKGGADEQE
ncbi:MAG: rod shape-determining protein MreC [Spirochaetales bacterium]|nr:rod shape-determining protein MreC [Spirochaetales bacterium]